MIMEQVLWVEKYRPHKIEECILPDSLKKIFQGYVKDKFIPNLLLTGPAGVGKTTVARALCDEIGCDYLFLNGSDTDDVGISSFRTKIKSYASAASLDGGRKVIIIDEADYMNPNQIQPALRGTIEEFAENCSFIFTCNFKDKIIEPLHSRCSVIDFRLKNADKPAMATQLLARITYILNEENVIFKKSVLVEIIKKHFPDYRRTLNELQRYAQQGNKTIDEDILSVISADATFAELIKSLKEQDFTAVRLWVGKNSDMDPARIFRMVYDAAYDHIEGKSIPAAVMILAEYAYRAAFVADPEINTTAALTRLMVDCEWKK
jgi:DNA polymerase III delta prime subunit